MATVPTIPFPVQDGREEVERGKCMLCRRMVPMDQDMHVHGMCPVCVAKTELVDLAAAIRAKGSDGLIVLAAALLHRLRDEPAVGLLPAARRAAAEGLERAARVVREASRPRPYSPEEIEESIVF